MNLNDVPPCFGLGQVPAELDQLRDLYVERKPLSVLEIGVWFGGTLREWLTNAAPGATVVAVDPEHQNPNLYEQWTPEGVTLVVGTGRSSDLEHLIREHSPYDWVFIDGDHSHDGVRADMELTTKLVRPGGLLLLHDIAAEGFPPLAPRIWFEALRDSGYDCTEIVETPPDWYPADSGHGIGVVQL